MKPKRKSRLSREVASARKNIRKWWKKWHNFQRAAMLFTPYMRKRRGTLSMALAFTVGFMLMTVLVPWPMKMILDNVILDRPLPSFLAPFLSPVADDRISLLYVLAGAVVLIAVLRGIMYFYRELLTKMVGHEVVAKVRVDLYSHLQRLSFSFHDRRRTGDLLSRLTVDIRTLREVLVALPLEIIGEVLLVVVMAGVMFLMDWRLALISLTVIPALALLVRIYQGPLRDAIRRQRQQEGSLSTMALEVLGAIKVVQGFTREEAEIQRFSGQNNRSLRSGLRAVRLEAKLNWSSEIVLAIGTAVVIMVAVHRVLAGALSPGDLLVFVAYLRAFYRPMRHISRMTQRAARGAACGERVLEILGTVPTV